ncbi:hypothetical protein L3X38_012145 [Prunus dulcis]|uniref:Transposase n=1 Tax=Prunus dulcis TaxID=3755 RepID=A0AAD4WIR4_PRUDU|nr:hypothetical protein L3X38_012145 [Prunus dulcis]
MVLHGEDEDNDSDESDSSSSNGNEVDNLESIYDMHGLIEEVFLQEPHRDVGKFYKLLEEAEEPLFMGCETYSNLSFVVTLMHIKCSNNWSNKSFNMLLEVLKKTFPFCKKLPTTKYGVKKIVKDLGFHYEKIDAYMRWHYEERVKDGVLRHPANSEAWKSLDRIRKKGPGQDIDVYMRPLIDELQDLWGIGVETYDISKKQNFQMRAAIMWTINDYPAYAYMSGWSTQGKLACPCCGSNTSHLNLHHGSKQLYMGHRRFLQLDHSWLNQKMQFDNIREKRVAPTRPSGIDMINELSELREITHGKNGTKQTIAGFGKTHNWKKHSIFFKLPYWKTLLLRHNLDVMHIEKNVFENVIGTVMNIDGETKDSLNARLDLQEMGIRSKLHPIEEGEKIIWPKADYELSNNDKKAVFQWLMNLKVPDGHSANISRYLHKLKSYVRNKAHPEGSIAKAFGKAFGKSELREMSIELHRAATYYVLTNNDDSEPFIQFDFSEQWFLFFPNLIKYKEKEILSVKIVSQHQSKDSGSKKNGGKELGMAAPQKKSSKKMKFASSSAETEPTSQTTISDDSKSGRGMSTMPRVVKRKLQKLRPIVEYNKRGKGIGQAHSEMQSYIGVLARSRVPLMDMKWSQIPKDIKEQIWEAVDMAFVVGQGGKKSVLASAAKKWKDFKSTLTRHYILPYTNDREKLSQPPETYKFIEKAQWDAIVASRLSKDFESVHSQHAQIREKLEYNHRLSRKGYAGLEDQLEETMPGVEIDRSTLWKRARQDKHGNIPDPKVAEKAKLIDELQKQVSEGKVSVYGSNDVLTMALGPEHPGRVRGVGAGISPRQYFNLPKPQKMSFDDRLKDSLRVLLQEETKKMEAKAREEALRMEARTKQH